ncbi:hypothetical protein OIDMADRAFT_21316 [Oidiodendron maius Zn]|uniref:Uncharacterized protein n=1 Tax=Oidiodendron maius (strain Zn) TaxID=913774 RepID=A0A0C3GV41_OIDMZ|nr:hypothetical protein OIDMADRAFT_21316 [Oidiodendron maius Zn]
MYTSVLSGVIGDLQGVDNTVPVRQRCNRSDVVPVSSPTLSALKLHSRSGSGLS